MGEAYYLLLLDAQNKCDTVFRSDTLQRALVSYYDRHGTPNERMRAYYLLGRACHDMGEVPKALDSYLTAVSVADTTKANCDYYTLCRVYGQMAEIFHRQFLPEDEMQATKNSERYARFANDTLSALKAFELRLRSYYLKNEMDSVLYYTQKAQEKYRKNGYNKEAATLLLPAISILLDRHEYNKARECMNYYEKESKLFDAYGNIANGWELYYYYKGVYMQATNQIDSALYYYRKVLNTGNDETAYKGLLSAYEVINNTDSIAKYSRLFTNANDTALLNYQRQTLRQTSAISSFNHYQNEKQQARNRYLQARSNTYALLIILIITTIIVAALVYYIMYRKKQTKIREKQLIEKYKTLQSQLQHAQRDLRLLNYELKESKEQKDADNNAINKLTNQIKEKNQEIDNLTQQLSDAFNKAKEALKKELEQEFTESEILERFNNLSVFKLGQEPPSEKEWATLVNLFRRKYIDYYAFISKDNKLSKSQLRVCILIRLGFKPSEIKTLFGTSKWRVNNLKKEINTILFNIEKAGSLVENLTKHY